MSYVQWSRGVSRWFTPLARQVCAFSGVQSLIPVLLSCQRPIRDRTRLIKLCASVFTSAVLPPAMHVRRSSHMAWLLGFLQKACSSDPHRRLSAVSAPFRPAMQNKKPSCRANLTKPYSAKITPALCTCTSLPICSHIGGGCASSVAAGRRTPACTGALSCSIPAVFP